MEETGAKDEVLKWFEGIKNTKPLDTDNVCMGDVICLYSIERHGFITSNCTSSVFNEIGIAENQDSVNPNYETQKAILFHIYPPDRYKAGKAYRKLKSKVNAEINTKRPRSSVELKHMKANAENEETDNLTDLQRFEQKPIAYGDAVQLKHLFTCKFVHANPTKTSQTETSNVKVELLPENGKTAQFRVLPRYKVKSAGETVKYRDQIAFESVKSPGQYLHASADEFPPEFAMATTYELNMSNTASGFTVYQSGKPGFHPDSGILIGGSYIQLYHKEIEAYVTAEGVFGGQIVENAHLRVRPINNANPKSLRPSTNPITCWAVEKVDCNYKTDKVAWEEEIRLLHATTRCYLMLSKGKTVGLTYNRDDPATIFALVAVGETTEAIRDKAYVRIKHAETGYWLAGDKENYAGQFKQSSNLQKDDLKALKWSKAARKKLRVSETMSYDDAYTLQIVSPTLTNKIDFVAGQMPFLQTFLHYFQRRKNVDNQFKQQILNAFAELIDYMSDEKEPKLHQKLCRAFLAVDIVIDLLKVPSSDHPDKSAATMVHAECYRWLTKYLDGDSRKNELYVAKHYEFMERQCFEKGIVGLQATFMLMEMLRDNMVLVDLISEKQVEEFIGLITLNKNYRYLELLEIFCVVNGLAVVDKQTHVAKAWLVEAATNKKLNVVTYLAMGSKIGQRDDTVYVSDDNKRTWIPLHEFCTVNDSDSEPYQFLEYQLFVYDCLCKGRNAYAIELITEEMELCTMEVAFNCLKDRRLPDGLRAKFCMNIIDMFIDVMGNTSLNDREQLVFSYDDVVVNQQPTIRKERMSSMMMQCLPLPHVKELKLWVSEFLQRHSIMVSTNITENTLIEKVLALVYSLSDFGYYGDTDDVKKLVRPLLAIMDGRTDSPFPIVDNTAETMKEQIEEFRENLRYEPSPETDAIVKTKLMCCSVMDLLFNFRFKTRLTRFLKEFKIANDQPQISDLTQFLQPNEDFRGNAKIRKIGLKRCAEIFRETDFLPIDLVEILKDLEKYRYNLLASNAFLLHDRFYTTYENLFNKCVQAKILVTEKSLITLKQISSFIPEIKHLKASKLNAENVNRLREIFQTLTRMCCLENDVREPHSLNQEIIYNHAVLGDTFDLIGRAVLLTGKNKSYGLKVIRYTLCFMKALARRFLNVQQRLCDRIDTLIALNDVEVETELGEVLIEVFSGNVSNCLKIEMPLVQTFVLLYTGRRHPVWLSVLAGIVRIDYYPIRQNQSMVMRALMREPETLAFITESTVEEKISVMSQDDLQRHRFCGLINLLGLCAFGNNRSSESICQSILNLRQILMLMNVKHVCFGILNPLAQFFTNVFFKPTSQYVVGELRKKEQSRLFASFIQLITAALDQGQSILSTDSRAGVEYLREKPVNIHKFPIDDNHEKKETLHFCHDSAIPFIYSFYKFDFARMLDVDQRLIDSMIRALEGYASVAAFCLSKPYHKVELCNALRLVSVLLNRKIQVPKELTVKEENLSESRVKYLKYYKEELHLNEEFISFAKRFKLAYQGKNTVRAQVGYPVQPPDRQYVDIETDEYLPLGEEFQAMVKSFLLNPLPKDRRLYGVSGIMTHLQHSATTVWHSESEKRAMSALDWKAIQLLRAMVWNEMCRLPENKRLDPEEHARISAETLDTQNHLNAQQIVESVMPHLGRKENEIVKEAFYLFNILYKNTDQTPRAFVRYVKQHRHADSFITMRERLLRAESLIYEQRYLREIHKKTLMEAQMLKSAVEKPLPPIRTAFEPIEKLKTPLKTSDFDETSQNDSESISLLNQNDDGDSKLIGTNVAKPPKVLNFNELLIREKSVHAVVDPLQKFFQPPPGETDSSMDPVLEALDTPHKTLQRETFYVNIILYLLQSLCDLQFTDAQNLMRQQPTAHNINMVTVTANFLGVLCMEIKSDYIDMTANAFNSICELVRGNRLNQIAAFEAKVLDFINSSISLSEFADCSEEQVVNFLKWIAYSIIYLTEENQRTDEGGLGTEMNMSVLNKSAIVRLMTECYQKGTDAKKYAHLSELTRYYYLDNCYLYYTILKRAEDLKQFNYRHYDCKELWFQLGNSCMSVEFLKENRLQKFHFRVYDMKSLRNEVSTRLMWEVDRTTQGAKIRDYVAWAHNIVADIKAQRKVNSNRAGRFFVHGYMTFSQLVLAISACIQIALLIVWERGTEKLPAAKPTGNATFNLVIQYVIGPVHNCLCLCLFISFFLSNASGLNSWRKRKIEKIRNQISNLKSRTSVTTQSKPSKLELSFLSGATLNVFVAVAMSLMGTIISPAFFSFHLLQIVSSNQLLSRVMKAVTTNGTSLFWVLILGLILIYMHALVGYLVLRDIIKANPFNLQCFSLWSCTLTTLREGLIQGLKRFNYPVVYTTGKDFTIYSYKIIFDMLFFISILTIMMNVIFGIIVDTFRTLRDAKWRIEKEMESRCFICGRNSYEFEQKGYNFNYHVQEEHSMVGYIFLLDRYDDTFDPYRCASEMHIAQCVEEENYNFFPVGKAMSLDGVAGVEDSVARDAILQGQIDKIMRKAEEVKRIRQKRAAQKRQMEVEMLQKRMTRSHSLTAIDEWDEDGFSDEEFVDEVVPAAPTIQLRRPVEFKRRNREISHVSQQSQQSRQSQPQYDQHQQQFSRRNEQQPSGQKDTRSTVVQRKK